MSSTEQQELTPTLVRYLNRVEGWSLAKIGRKFGLSRERIRQIANDGLDKKRKSAKSRRK